MPPKKLPRRQRAADALAASPVVDVAAALVDVALKKRGVAKQVVPEEVVVE